MATYSIDTAAAIRKLKEAQCDEPLAEAIVEIVAAQHDEIATKADLEMVRKDIEQLRAATKTEFEVVQKDLEQLELKIDHLSETTQKDLERSEASLRTELANLHTRVIIWIVGTGIGILGGGKLLDFFFLVGG